MAGRTSGLLAFLRRAEPRSAPSGWALTLDAAVAVGAAAVAVLEVAQRTMHDRIIFPGGVLLTEPVRLHAPLSPEIQPGS